MSVPLLDVRGILVACPACTTTNRLAYARLDKPSKCGRCHVMLPAAVDPIEAPSTAVFDALVRDSALPVVVDFWAPWCGPCRMVAPEIEKVARNTAGRWLIVKVDTEALPDLGDRHRVQSIPTMAVFRFGREIARTSGARPAPAIEAFVSAALQSAA